MNLVIVGHDFRYETENLIRLFFPLEKINVTAQRDNGDKRYIITEISPVDEGIKIKLEISLGGDMRCDEEIAHFQNMKDGDTTESYSERKLEVLLFKKLCEMTGYTPSWGILTGVRPAKLMTNLCEKHGEEKAKNYFINELYVSKEKTELALTVAKAEKPIINKSSEKSFSLYISIPFCPTRCSYCSFVSHSNNSAKKLIPQYVELLVKEIEDTAKIAKELDLKLESVYIGGGTPTALDEVNLQKVTDAVCANFDMPENVEFTIESGRPDSITKEKLDVIRNSGAQRISINPQTFNDSVLEIIGRKHTSQQTIDAMNLARDCDLRNINMDIIAGLPTDTLESFNNTLTKIFELDPESVTVHTLALKRSSTLVTDGGEKGDAKTAGEMLSLASKRLTENGYKPYYMYRQSKCLGNLENVGWAKPGYECDYNVYMMEETHTVLAVGAGSVTKLRNPKSNQIERIFNYKYPYEYINGFDEILSRKKRIGEFYREIYR